MRTHPAMNAALRACALALGLLALAAVSGAVQAQPAVRVYQENRHAVVGIEAGDGTGTGLVLDRKGLVSTNHHVIEGYREVTVTLFLDDGNRSVPGTVVETDPAHDLALIEIRPPARLRPVRLGSSDRLQVGQEVVAIGNPLGLESTVSSGIVSQIREIEDVSIRGRLIQTTAPISPGSSGGGLFDRSGRVVGITTMQAVIGQNLNFAVPVERLKDLVASHGGGARSRGLAERPRRARPERPARAPRGSSAPELEGDLAEALRLFDLGMERLGSGFERSREGRLVARARREVERGRHEAALKAFVTYSRPIERPEVHFFWGVVDAVGAHPALARRHLRALEGHPSLQEQLEDLIEAAEFP